MKHFLRNNDHNIKYYRKHVWNMTKKDERSLDLFFATSFFWALKKLIKNLVSHSEKDRLHLKTHSMLVFLVKIMTEMETPINPSFFLLRSDLFTVDEKSSFFKSQISHKIRSSKSIRFGAFHPSTFHRSLLVSFPKHINQVAGVVTVAETW